MKLQVNKNNICSRCTSGSSGWVFCDKVIGLTGPLKKCTFFEPVDKVSGNKKQGGGQWD